MVKKLTLNEIKNKLITINPNIEITDTEYINSKVPMGCHCLVCDEYWKTNWNNLSNNNGCPNCYYNSKFIPDDEIIKFVINEGYGFIEFVNKGKLAREFKIKIKCPEGHEYTVGYAGFRKGRRCKPCGYKIVAEKTKKNVEDIEKFITENRYSIVGELNYINSKSEFTIVCSNGHIRTICYNHLTNTPNCPECIYGHKYKYTVEDISVILEELDMKYIDGYKDSHTPFKYKCSCGNITYGYLYRIRNGSKCPNCSPITMWNYEEVKKLFESLNCELLSTEYINVKQKFQFKCRCGKLGCKTLHDFINSPQCPDCGLENRSGENHPNWNPNLTDDERMKNRKFKEYEHWRLAVYERDNFTCQCCGDSKGGNLNAHHLDSHDWAKDKRLDLDNAITLCVNCHTDFHNIYGYGKNTKEQFEKYMNDI